MIKKIYNFLFFKTIFEKYYNGREVLIILDINNDHGWYIKFFIKKNEKLVLNQLMEDFYFSVSNKNCIELQSYRIFLNYYKNDKKKINELIEQKFYDYFIEKNKKLKLFRTQN